MLSTLTRLGLLATLVGGSAIAVVGSDRARLYYETGKEAVMSAIDEAQGLDAKLRLIKTQVRDLDREERRLNKEAIENVVELESLRKDVEQRRTNVEKLAKLLDRVSVMLATGEPHYDIGGRSYARAEVERDAAEKLAVFEVQKETLKNLEETLATKEKAQELAAENVSRATALRADLGAQVSLLEARLEKLRAKQNFAATVEDVVDTKDLDSAIARARERIVEFGKQLEVKDRMLDQKLKAGREAPPKGIDYEGAAPDAKDLSARIRAALDGRDVAVSTSASPAVSLSIAVH